MTRLKLRTPHSLLVAGAISIVYFAAAEFGLSLASVHTNVSPIWPPTGVAIAALLIFGRSLWPAIFVGALAANLLTHISVATAAGIAVGNTLEALTAWYLLRRIQPPRKTFESIIGVLQFVLFAAVLSPAVSATIGDLSLCLSGAASWSNFTSLWLTWWLGDGFGALVIAPFLISWTSRYELTIRAKVLIEGGLLLVLLFIVSMSVFAGWIPGRKPNYPIEHLCLPFLVWAALRFDQRLLCSAILLLTGVAVWGTSGGKGPFIQPTPNESLLLLLLFVGGSTLMALALHAAMSEQRKAEEEKLTLHAEMELQRARVAAIVAHVPGVVWEAWGQPDAANQRINFVSDYVEEMLGYSQDDWLSTPNFWLTIVHPDDRERAAAEAAQKFSTGKGGTSRFRWLAKDGREIWVDAHSVVVCDDNGDALGMRGVTMDVTRTIQAENERSELLVREREARAQAEEANRLKDEFLANTSHELRTPLNAIVGWSRLLRSGQLDENTSAHAFEAIERNAWSQAQIVNDLLDVSRIITGKLHLTYLPTNLLNVINAAIDVVRPAAEAKGIKIVTNNDSAGLIVNGDVNRLQQIAWNLLSNAVKFTPDGGVVEITLRRDNSFAKLMIADTGPGIKPEFLPHAFERFTQAESGTTKKHGGLGLGLAIVRHLAELHGGHVEAKNREGEKGAVFTVTLPALN
ncbi:MAG: MASE1 domain-containing protein [bacterium]